MFAIRNCPTALAGILAFCLCQANAEPTVLFEGFSGEGSELKVSHHGPFTPEVIDSDLVLQRSTDLLNWEELARFATSAILEEFLDENPPPANAFYRVIIDPHAEDPLREVLIQFRHDARPDELNALCGEVGLLCPIGIIETPLMREKSEEPIICFETPGPPEDVIDDLLASPLVKTAQPNARIYMTAVPNDPLFKNGVLFAMTNQNFATRAENVWTRNQTGSHDVVVAVIDSGVDIFHPDLQSNIWRNPNEIAGNGLDDDGNGYVDDVHGWDFVDDDALPLDENYHGTHVAGTIGASGGNGIGVVGVNWKVSILPLRILGADGRGDFADASRAMDYITHLRRKGVNIVVANHSYGADISPSRQPTLHRRFSEAAIEGVLSVCAAGNSGVDNDLSPHIPSSFDTSTSYPSGFHAPYDAVISVASIEWRSGILAHNRNGQYSNYGLNSVDLAAPGGGLDGLIASTIPSNRYAYSGGTSMAAPHVAGAIALYASIHPGASPEEIRTALFKTAKSSNQLKGRLFTGAYLDIDKFTQTPPPTPNPRPNARDDQQLLTGLSAEIRVLDNDSDPDGGTLTVFGFTQGRFGTVSRKGGNQNVLVYRVTNTRFATDSFSYTVSDGKGGFDSATVRILNQIENSAPIPFDDHIVVEQGERVNLRPLLWNDIDPNGDRLTIECAGNIDGCGGTRPTKGAIQQGPRTWFYWPLATGTDSFTYRITDGEFSRWASVTVEIVASNGRNLRRPKLEGPYNNRENTRRRPNFRWHGLAGASAYDLELTQKRGRRLLHGFADLDGLSFRLPKENKLDPEKNYFWRVRGQEASGAPGPWSRYWKFRTREAAPPNTAPRPKSPPAGTSLPGLTASFTWDEVEDADEYLFQIAKGNLDPSSIVASRSVLTAGLRAEIDPADPLDENQVYFWRVIPKNDEGDGPASVWTVFSTRTPLLSESPILIEPVGQARVPLRPELKWSEVAGASSYNIQIWRANTGRLARSYDNVSATDFTIPEGDDLPGDRLYRWRVQANNAAGSSPWSAYEEFRTSLLNPRLATPSNGATLNDPTPTLSWNGSTGATSYTLQIASAPAGDQDVYTSTGTATSATVPNSAALGVNQTYFWRVRADGPQDSVWSSWWSFSVRTAPNNAPTQQLPRDGATNQNVRPTFTWSGSPQSTSFEIEIFRVNTGGNLIRTYNATGNSFRIPEGEELPGDRQYDWRIRGKNDVGTGPWSAKIRFRTTILAPTLTLPPNKAVDVSITPTFEWTEVPGAGNYTFQISADDTSSILDGRTITINGTAFSVAPEDDLKPNRTYFWRVTANGPQNSRTSGWSEFRTGMSAPNAAPTQESPKDGATGQNVRPTFTWSGSPQSNSFEIQIFRVNTGGNLIRTYVATGTSFRVPEGEELPGDRQYDWRIRGKNSLGTGPWSAKIRFRTTILAPTLTAPANRATNVSIAPTFTWTGVSGAGNYTFEISVDNTTSILEGRTVTITDTTHKIAAADDLKADRTYFWRVRANGPQTSRNSDWFEFRTQRTAPNGAPTQVSPVNGVTGQNVRPTFTWNGTRQSTVYDIEIFRVNTGGNLIRTYSTSATSFRVPEGADLPGDRQYDWRVRGRNELGAGPWSGKQRFRTTILAPTLVSPGNQANNVSRTATFSWNAVPGANNYTFEISVDGTSRILSRRTVTTTGTSTKIPSNDQLRANRVYFWRVRANGPQTSRTSGWFQLQTGG